MVKVYREKRFWVYRAYKGIGGSGAIGGVGGVCLFSFGIGFMI